MTDDRVPWNEKPFTVKETQKMKVRLAAWSVAGVLGLAPPAFAASEYGSVNDTEYQQIVKDLETNPSLMAERPEISRRLTTAQIDQLVRDSGLNPYTWVAPVIVKAKQAENLQQHDITDISVMAVRGGKLVPIPFQIDERDKDGWVYVDGVSKTEVNGVAGKFDANDEIVFMHRDTGKDRFDAAATPLSEGKLVQEVALTDNGATRYAYLVTGSTARDKAKYVSYDESTHRFKGNFHNFKQSKDNLLIFEDYRANAGPTPEHRVLDTVFLDLSTGVITSWPRLSVGIQNIEAKLMGVKHGPIREVLLLSIRVVVAGIPVFFIRSDMTLYDEGIDLPVRLNIPGGEILTRVLNKPIIDIGLDMNDMRGGRFSTALNPTGQYGKIDGKMDEVEKKLAIQVPDKNWIWLDTARGFDVLMQVRIPPDWPVKAELYYEDAVKPEKKFDTEKYPEALPRMGVRVTELPVGKLNIDLSVILWFPATVGESGPVAFAKRMDNPPKPVLKAL